MVSSRGRFGIGDDDLTPGGKQEGGLRRDLVDGDRDPAGTARIIAEEADTDHPGSEGSGAHVRKETAPRIRSTAEVAFERAVSDVVARLLDHGVAVATPHVQRFWEGTARPAIRTQWAKRPGTRKADR